MGDRGPYTRDPSRDRGPRQKSSMASITSSRSGRSTSDYATNSMSTATPSVLSSSTHPPSSSHGGSSTRTLQNMSRDPSRDQIHREIIEMSKTMSRERIDDIPSPRDLRDRSGRREESRDQSRDRTSRGERDRDTSRERLMDRMSSIDRMSSLDRMSSVSNREYSSPRDRRLSRGTSLDRYSSLERGSSRVSRDFSYDRMSSLDKSHETMVYPSRDYLNYDVFRQDNADRCSNNGCNSKAASLKDVSQLIESMEQKVPQAAVRPQTLPVQRPKMVSRGVQFPPRPYIRKKAQSKSELPEGEDEEEELFPTLKSVFRPMFHCLKCFGLMWKEMDNYKLGLFTVHSVLVLLLVWINAGRFFAVYADNTAYGPGLLVKILIHLWMLQTAVGLPYCIFTYQESLHKIIKDWESYKLQHTGISLKSMKWYCFKICVFGNGIFGAFSVICIIASMIKPPNMMYILLIPFTYDKNAPAYAWFLYYLFHFYIVAIWLQPLLILITTTVLLKQEFNEAARKLESSISSARREGTFHPQLCDLEAFRQRHLQLCRLSEKLDHMHSAYVLVTFVVDIPSIVILISVLLFHDGSNVNDMEAFAAGVASFVILLVHLVATTIVSASLNEAAIAPKRLLHDVDFSVLTIQETTSAQVFVTRVTFDHMGLTIWRMVKIDRNVLVLVFVLLITFMLVLFKFAMVLAYAKPADDIAGIQAVELTPLNGTTPMPPI